METSIKTSIKRGKEALETYIENGEEGLIILANSYNIKLKTLKCEMSSYSTRILNPKPTEEELMKYYEAKTKKLQQAKNTTIEFPELKKEFSEKNIEDGMIIRRKEAFYAFLETIINPSAIVDLAFKQGIEPERVRVNAFNYAKRIEEPKPTAEELETFYAINQMRKESVNKERVDFTFVEQLLNLNSNLVADYLEMVISSELNLTAVINKIDLYIKYYNDEIKNIQKITLIKKHLLANEEYINMERRNRSIQEIANNQRETYRQKIINILESYLIDDSLEIKFLLNQFGITEQTFNQHLKQFENGTPKEQLLFKEYNKKLDEEYREIAGTVKLIVNYLTNGIEKNGEQGKFNILDYCRLINVKPDIFLTKARRVLKLGFINRIELNKVMNFFMIISTNNLICTEEELLTYQFSYNNMTVEDEVTKRKIIHYLNMAEIPLCLNVYYAALEDYLKGHLSLDSYTLE